MDRLSSPLAPVDKSTSALPLMNVASFVFVIFFNAISSTGLISKLGIGDVSRLYTTLITPAGYAFSIWGIIYFAIAVFVVWQAIPSVRDDVLVFDRIGWWFSVSCLFNVIWIVLFVQATLAWIWVSSFFLFLIFGSLLVIVLRVDPWSRAFAEDVPGRNISSVNLIVTYLGVDFAFSIYCAWTTVASILNVSLSLIGSGFYGNGHQDVWAVIILVVASVIFLGMVMLKNNWAYGLVFTWAAMAIKSNAKSTSCTGVANFDDDAGCTRVQNAAMALAVIVGIASAYRLVYFIISLWQQHSKKAAESLNAELVVSAPIQFTGSSSEEAEGTQKA